LDRGAYYRNYYQLKKELIRTKYYEKKEQKQREYELYKNYGGEKNYYKNSLINSGFLIIK
jgi:hypothetical protein